MNVNSIHSHGKDVLAQMAIRESNSDIVFLTETKLGDYSNTFNVSGYQIATQQNRKQGAGGVMILHKTEVKVHDSESESTLEEIQSQNVDTKNLQSSPYIGAPQFWKKTKMISEKLKSNTHAL